MSLHEGHVRSAHDVFLIPEQYHTAVWRIWDTGGIWVLLKGWSSPEHRGTQGTQVTHWVVGRHEAHPAGSRMPQGRQELGTSKGMQGALCWGWRHLSSAALQPFRLCAGRALTRWMPGSRLQRQ